MLSVLINILLFVCVISVLVFVHELGHFLAAKSVHATIHEFSIGFGPKILSKKWKGIMYSIRAIPLGGYVKVAGDGDPGDEKEKKKDKKDPNSLEKKSKLAQAWVMSAGVIMNVLFTVIVYYIILWLNGWNVTMSAQYTDFRPVIGETSLEAYENITYDGFSDDSGAEEAGMPEQGVITKVNGRDLKYSFDLAEALDGKENKSVTVRACSDGECKDYSVKVSGDGYLGLVVSSNYYVILSYEDSKFVSGVGQLLNTIVLSYDRIAGLFKEAKSTGDYSEVANTFSGPVGIYIVIDYFKQFGFWSIISLMGDLSLSLALVNILPIPALDGGRITILVSEWIVGKDLNEETEAWIINISFGLLMLLVVAIFVKDLLSIDSLKSMFT